VETSAKERINVSPKCQPSHSCPPYSRFLPRHSLLPLVVAKPYRGTGGLPLEVACPLPSLSHERPPAPVTRTRVLVERVHVATRVDGQTQYCSR
jgi:hypothetical protein